MIVAINALMFLGTVWTVASFGFVAVALSTVMNEPSYIANNQLYFALAVNAISAAISLALSIFLAMLLLRRKFFIGNRLSRLIFLMIGAVYFSVGIYSFFIIPTEALDSFFGRFLNNARFEFICLGAIATVLYARNLFGED
ncbi:hypothetical protein LRS03_00400 [Rhizobacter sp. J219]|uniref:hypothetical protein n=1 Tax=Rhizobacter sp. J219 TaxID=2898430 RepID=UPI002151EDF9|nr:hypothetical protein [Rhizobacter sp. J219]MCR5881405.1 hypothetical protein [Rhizobacter sp. J219]